MNKQQRDFALKLKNHILAHADKVYMNSFVLHIDEIDKANAPEFKELTCGTVGCIAGTACFLADGKWTTSGSEYRGEELLGLNYYEAHSLFYFPYDVTQDLYANEREEIIEFKPGTREYARVVAQALQKCIDRNYHETCNQD